MTTSTFVRCALIVLVGAFFLSRLMQPAASPSVDPVPQVDGQVDELMVGPDGSLVHRATTFQEMMAVPGKIIVVDFWAKWCGPCRMLAPELESVARELGDRGSVIKVDVDSEPRLAAFFKINGIPDVRFFKNGKAVGGTVGFQSSSSILAQLP